MSALFTNLVAHIYVYMHEFRHVHMNACMHTHIKSHTYTHIITG